MESKELRRRWEDLQDELEERENKEATPNFEIRAQIRADIREAKEKYFDALVEESRARAGRR